MSQAQRLLLLACMAQFHHHLEHQQHPGQAACRAAHFAEPLAHIDQDRKNGNDEGLSANQGRWMVR
jgi:hypothetical protein